MSLERINLYKTTSGIFATAENKTYPIPTKSWSELVNRKELFEHLNTVLSGQDPIEGGIAPDTILAPIDQQEIWAAGVTYYRSREARMDESRESGGATFYDKVYEADRPELFFKATPARTSGPGEHVYIRRDSQWNVPEPELTLFISTYGSIEGYTIGNDMSSRDIEGANPLYLPQAKVYSNSAALGPCLMVQKDPIAPSTTITLSIKREGKEVVNNHIEVSQIKRKFEELVQYLFMECEFPNGAYLMTGTGIIPEDDFSLKPGDEVAISIENIGTLYNIVSFNPRRQ